MGVIRSPTPAQTPRQDNQPGSSTTTTTTTSPPDVSSGDHDSPSIADAETSGDVRKAAAGQETEAAAEMSTSGKEVRRKQPQRTAGGGDVVGIDTAVTAAAIKRQATSPPQREKPSKTRAAGESGAKLTTLAESSGASNDSAEREAMESGATARPTGDSGETHDEEDTESWSVVGAGGKVIRKEAIPKVKTNERPEAIIFAADNNLLETNFNAVCDDVARHLKGKVEEPRFTRAGELVIVAEDAEDRATLLSLTSVGGIPVQSRVSGQRSTVKGKICGVHPSLSDTTIINALGSLGVTEAIRVRAKNAHTGIVMATDQVILTFVGIDFPTEVRLGLKTHGVMLYREPHQCYRCYSLDHIKPDCPWAAPRCRRCGSTNHLRKDCNQAAKCCLCKSNHEATSGSCPHRLRRMEQLKKSAIRVIQRKPEATPVKICAPVADIQPSSSFSKRSFSAVVQNGVKVPAATPKVQPPAGTVIKKQKQVTNDVHQINNIDKVVQCVTEKIVPIIIDAIVTQIGTAIQRALSTALPSLHIQAAPPIAPGSVSELSSDGFRGQLELALRSALELSMVQQPQPEAPQTTSAVTPSLHALQTSSPSTNTGYGTGVNTGSPSSDPNDQ